MAVTPKKGLPLPAFNTPNWDVILNSIFSSQDNDTPLVAAYDATAQGAALVAQPLFTSPGNFLYRVSFYAVVTRAATTSSSLNVSINFPDADTGVAEVLSGTAQAGNTVGAICAGDFVISAASAGSITATTTYASAGGTTMQYALHIRIEELF